MRVRDSVFDSTEERVAWGVLNERWADKFDLHPHTPLANILEPDPGELPVNEENYLNHTSVDWTVCEGDRPILSIEYDGLCQGFNHSGVFKPVRRSRREPNRDWKMNFKLRVAKAAGYPLVIVALDESRIYGDRADHITILDGLIGQFYASRRFHEEVVELVDRRHRELAHLDPERRTDIVADEAEDLELRLLYKHDPLSQRAAELQHEYYFSDLDDDFVGTIESTHRYETTPGFRPSAQPGPFGAMNPAEAEWYDCKFELQCPWRRDPITTEARVRCVELTGTYAPWIARDIAEVLAFKEAIRERNAMAS